jgi:hypothetical protein
MNKAFIQAFIPGYQDIQFTEKISKKKQKFSEWTVRFENCRTEEVPTPNFMLVE